MTEENKQDNNGKIEPETAEQKDAEIPLQSVKELKLTIIKNLENGSIGVEGPGDGQLYDKYLCLGLLDEAKDFIKAHNARVNQSHIIKAQPTMAQQIRGMFRGRR